MTEFDLLEWLRSSVFGAEYGADVNDLPRVLAFEEAVEPMLHVYRHALFSFVGIVHARGGR